MLLGWNVPLRAVERFLEGEIRPALGLTSRLISGCTSRIEFATTKTRSAGLVSVILGLISSGHDLCSSEPRS